MVVPRSRLFRRLATNLDTMRGHGSSLGDQFERALTSVPLDVAEGASFANSPE
jgi:hypothetical protein